MYCKSSLEGTTVCKLPQKKDECDSMSLGALLRCLTSVQLWPPSDVLMGKSVMDLSKDLKEMRNFGNQVTYIGADIPRRCDHSSCGSKTRFSRFIEHTKDSTKGLSLARFRPEVEIVSLS